MPNPETPQADAADVVDWTKRPTFDGDYSKIADYADALSVVLYGRLGRARELLGGSNSAILRDAEHAITAIRGEIERLSAELQAAKEALALAVRQNRCDMLLTGDELRICEAALSASPATIPAQHATFIPLMDLKREIEAIKTELNGLASLGCKPMWGSLVGRLDDLVNAFSAAAPSPDTENGK